MEWSVPLKNITITENSRQTNPAAVSRLEQEIRNVGWLPVSLPQVMFPSIEKGASMTDEGARTLEAVVIDGNHRVSAAKAVFADKPEMTIRCNCFSNISCPLTRRIVSDREWPCLVRVGRWLQLCSRVLFFLPTLPNEIARMHACVEPGAGASLVHIHTPAAPTTENNSSTSTSVVGLIYSSSVPGRLYRIYSYYCCCCKTHL